MGRGIRKLSAKASGGDADRPAEADEARRDTFTSKPAIDLLRLKGADRSLCSMNWASFGDRQGDGVSAPRFNFNFSRIIKPRVAGQQITGAKFSVISRQWGGGENRP